MIVQDWWYTSLLSVQRPVQPPLSRAIQADVVVIGAGMAGLSAALRLARLDRKVVLLERNICGGSSTGRSAGFLTPDSELELSQIVRRFGRERARDLWDAPVRGIELITRTAREHGLECDLLVQDSLFLGNDAGGWKDAQAEVAARKELGYPQQLYAPEAVPGILGSQAYVGGIRYPGTYGINALLYAQGVKQILLDAGVEVYESTDVLRIEGHTVHTHLGSVTASDVIFCIDKPQRTLTSHSRNVFHAQTFLSISEPLSDAELRLLFPSGEHLQCWDSDLVYSYFRLTGDNRLLLGGGSALTTFALHYINTPRVIRRVIRRFKRKFPFLANLEFVQYWPGLIDTTRDLLPTVMRDEQAPWVHWVLGCVGLPWAAFCGDLAARAVLGTADEDVQRYYRYFGADRRFLLPLWLERGMGKPLVFSLNNGWAKYYQRDRGARPARAGEFF